MDLAYASCVLDWGRFRGSVNVLAHTPLPTKFSCCRYVAQLISRMLSLVFAIEVIYQSSQVITLSPALNINQGLQAMKGEPSNPASPTSQAKTSRYLLNKLFILKLRMISSPRIHHSMTSLPGLESKYLALVPRSGATSLGKFNQPGWLRQHSLGHTE